MLIIREIICWTQKREKGKEKLNDDVTIGSKKEKKDDLEIMEKREIKKGEKKEEKKEKIKR